MDEDLRRLERAASGSLEARLAFRAAIERAGRSGEALGLAPGDRVRVRSCLPGRERVFFGRVTGTGENGAPIVMTIDRPYGDRRHVEVSGCPRCQVTFVRPGHPPRLVGWAKQAPAT